MDITVDNVFPDGPSSNPTQPSKALIRSYFRQFETAVDAGLSNGGLIYDTKANMDADLAHAYPASAWVIGDSTVANNGIYQKQGASGSGSWLRLQDLPYSFIRASNAGAGTANAIQATTSIPIPAGDAAAEIILNITANNTGASTVSFNGGSALTIKTASGADVQEDYLVAGGVVSGYVVGSTFQLTSEVGTAAAAAAAQAAADEAVDAANSVAVKYAADDAVLQALTGVNDKAIFNLANEGWWLPTSDDISAEITAGDPRYLPTSGDATGASGGFYQAGSVQTGNFFAEDGARIIRLADRLLGGDSVQSNGEAVATYVGSYMAGTAGVAADGTARLPGIGWIERNSGFAWSVGAGRIAVTGYAHSLGGTAGGTAIAAVFAADNDEVTNAHNVRAVYIDARRWPGVLSTTWAIEAQIANHGSTVNDSAYGADAGGGVTRGIDLYAGGDPTVQGTTNPVSSGLRFSENGGTFLKAMIFSATALYNHGGYKIAAELPSIGRIQWLANTNKDLGAFIQSDVTTVGTGMALRFANNLTTIEDLSGAKAASFQRTASAVNYPNFVSSVAGSGPALYALGSDTNIDFLLYPKGSGVLDYRKAVTIASSAPAFSALRYFPVKLNGTTHYVPCSPTTW